jgi:hypothetical protein
MGANWSIAYNSSCGKECDSSVNKRDDCYGESEAGAKRKRFQEAVPDTISESFTTISEDRATTIAAAVDVIIPGCNTSFPGFFRVG